jgi:hypothetical protein
MQSSARVREDEFPSNEHFSPDTASGVLIFCRNLNLSRQHFPMRRCQNRRQVRHGISFHDNGTSIHFHWRWPAQYIEQNLNAPSRRHDSQDESTHTGKSSIGKNHFICGRETIFDHHGFLRLKTFLQLLDHQVRYFWNPAPEMHQIADSVRVLNLIQLLFNDTADEYITGKERLDHAHHAPAGRPLDPQPGMEYLQHQVPPQIRGGDVLMLRLRPGAVPRWRLNLHR